MDREVDVVNWHTNNVTYYPPPNGLLLGESFHVIPGTIAKSGVSYTEDAALSGLFVDHTMAPNHLGPYSQKGSMVISSPPAGGSSSGMFQIYIGQSGNPIPEFPTVPVVTLVVLAASIVLLRRKKRNLGNQGSQTLRRDCLGRRRTIESIRSLALFL